VGIKIAHHILQQVWIFVNFFGFLSCHAVYFLNGMRPGSKHSLFKASWRKCYEAEGFGDQGGH
jgi:hypothetical protein